MCDALSRNTPKLEDGAQILLANCLAHGRRQFVEVNPFVETIRCWHTCRSIDFPFQTTALPSDWSSVGEAEAGSPKEQPLRAPIENPVLVPVRRAGYASGPELVAPAPESRGVILLLARDHVIDNAGELVRHSGDRFRRTKAGLHPSEIVSQEGLAPMQCLRGKS